jgi:predicted acylesterase/phospholipase RssA
MTIKHLVLSGGSYKGLYSIGSLNFLEENNFYDKKNIESIDAVSVGSIIGAFICLGVSWKDLIYYIINRPWERVFDLTPNMFIKMMSEKGLLDIDIFYSIFDTFLKNKGFTKNITMIDLYKHSNIELYIYATKLNSFTLECFSYKTYPQLKVIEALYMSCCLPFVFQPMIYNDSYYVDGGLINYYPIDLCLKRDISNNNILGIRITDDTINEKVTKDHSLFSYGFYIVNRLIIKNLIFKNKIKNEILIPSKKMELNESFDILKNKNMREKYIKDGEKFATLFLNYKTE